MATYRSISVSMQLRKNMDSKARLLIVEDHPIVRHGLIHLLNNVPDFVVCGEVDTARKAMVATETLKPDLAIIDISLPGTDGIELTKNLIAQWPELLILVYSMHDENLYAERALRAGAKGYVMKQEATEKLVDAIRLILDGQIYMSDKMATHLMHHEVGRRKRKDTSPVGALSDRELEVLHYFGQGHSTRQIADNLTLSVKTIESHRVSIKEKMNLRTVPELVRFAVQWVDQGTLCRG